MAIAKLVLDVEYIDGRTAKVRVLPVTQYAFEREHKKPLSAFANEQWMGDVFWLGWHASRSDLSFEEWLVTVAGVDIDEAEEADPTQPAQPAD